MNDTFFYASTWTDSSICTYSYENNTWTSAVFVNQAASTSGSHIAVDECGRVWYIIGSFGLRIFDQFGLEIASWNMSLGTDSLYDLLLLPNYVLLLTRWGHGRIVRYDPQLFCWERGNQTSLLDKTKERESFFPHSCSAVHSLFNYRLKRNLNSATCYVLSVKFDFITSILFEDSLMCTILSMN